MLSIKLDHSVRDFVIIISNIKFSQRTEADFCASLKRSFSFKDGDEVLTMQQLSHAKRDTIVRLPLVAPYIIVLTVYPICLDGCLSDISSCLETGHLVWIIVYNYVI